MDDVVGYLDELALKVAPSMREEFRQAMIPVVMGLAMKQATEERMDNHIRDIPDFIKYLKPDETPLSPMSRYAEESFRSQREALRKALGISDDPTRNERGACLCVGDEDGSGYCPCGFKMASGEDAFAAQRAAMGISGGPAVVDFGKTNGTLGGTFDGHQVVHDAYRDHYAFYEDGLDFPTIEVRSVGGSYELRLAPMPDPLTHFEHGAWYRVKVVGGVPTIRKLGD